jgi:2-dehydro-3-deoxy-D-gluconate 5-dehydrogenase
MKDSVQKMFTLDGKVALVTGGNGGIGEGIARGLAGAGADIVIAARNEAKTAKAAQRIRKDFGVEVVELKVDVLRETQIQNMVMKALDKCGKIDILVNNSGIAIHKLPQAMSIEEWDRNISTNLRSVFITSNAVYPFMKEAGGGNIINIASMFAIFGAGALPAYAASKGGIVQLTKSLAIAWASDKIRVNAILPGFINTELSAEGKRDIPALEGIVNGRTPLGRWGEPEDCAGAAIFLASSASAFLTGVSLAVDGGYSVM